MSRFLEFRVLVTFRHVAFSSIYRRHRVFSAASLFVYSLCSFICICVPPPSIATFSPAVSYYFFNTAAARPCVYLVSSFRFSIPAVAILWRPLPLAISKSSHICLLVDLEEKKEREIRFGSILPKTADRSGRATRKVWGPFQEISYLVILIQILFGRKSSNRSYVPLLPSFDTWSKKKKGRKVGTDQDF